jgi:hypothetical protein
MYTSKIDNFIKDGKAYFKDKINIFMKIARDVSKIDNSIK